uniref:Uncharacterized protein n=1 Tax=Rhizophora mucronata TaxID=61149 RepID=A0A2P2KRM3_RHIMU
MRSDHYRSSPKRRVVRFHGDTRSELQKMAALFTGFENFVTETMEKLEFNSLFIYCYYLII